MSGSLGDSNLAENTPIVWAFWEWLYITSLAVLKSLFSVDHNPASLRYRIQEVPSRVQYQKGKPNCIAFHSFQPGFPTNVQDIC